MELRIQHLIRTLGLDKVAEDLKLIVKQRDNLVLLKYSQIDAIWSEPASHECRGLILDADDNWNIVAYPYKKFFNLGEGYADQLDWANSDVFEKLDGSLITLWFYKNQWHLSTSGTIYADSFSNEGLYTFKELFWLSVDNNYSNKESFLSLLDKNYNYMFELCTPWNIVVTQHDTFDIYLHGARNMTNLNEIRLDSEMLIPFKKAKTYSLKNAAEIEATFQHMSWQEEGYVVCDHMFRRNKIKNPTYVSVHHVKTNASPYEIIEIIKKNEIDEFIVYFKEKEEFILNLKDRWDTTEIRLNNLVVQFNEKEFANQKEFALEVQDKIEKCFQFMFFSFRNNKLKTVRDAMNTIENKFWYNYLQK